MSYDTRNLAPAIPFLGIAAALEVTEQNGQVPLGRLVLDRPTSGYEWRDLDVTVSGPGVEFRCWKSGAGRLRLDTIRYQRLD